MNTKFCTKMVSFVLIYISTIGIARAEDDRQTPLELSEDAIKKQFAIFGELLPLDQQTKFTNEFLPLIVDANLKGDCGSVYFLCAKMIEDTYPHFLSKSKKYVKDYQSTNGIISDIEDKEVIPAIDDDLRKIIDLYDKLIKKLEKASTGPFVYDKEREQQMIAQVRDGLLMKKINIRQLIVKNNWTTDGKLFELISINNVHEEVLKLRQEVNELRNKVSNRTTDQDKNPEIRIYYVERRRIIDFCLRRW